MLDLGIGIRLLSLQQINYPLVRMVEHGNGQVPHWTSMTGGLHQKSIPGILVSLFRNSKLISGDFFDNKHKVVLGGSWATLPRIAGRRTFRNWYQSGYGYAWAGARVVKDLL